MDSHIQLEALKSVEMVDSVRYYSPTGDGMAVTDAEISTVENHSWKTFDQFKRRAFSVWIINLPNDGFKWSEGTCTCPKFLKLVYVQACCWYRLTPEVLQSASRSKKYSIGPETQAGETCESKEGITYSMIYLYFFIILLSSFRLLNREKII